LLHNRAHNNKRILFEAAQGSLPRCRSRHLSLRHQLQQFDDRRLERQRRPGPNLDRIIGVLKAYGTRVGRGPFPTELDDGSDGIGEKIRRMAASMEPSPAARVAAAGSTPSPLDTRPASAVPPN